MTATPRPALSSRLGLYGPIRGWMRRSVAFVDREDPLDRVAVALAESDAGAVLVLGPDGPAAVITESDIVRAVAEGGDLSHRWAAEIGTANLVAADAGDRALEVANAMVFHGIQHVVVREGPTVVGVACARDLLSAAVAEVAERA